MFILLSPCYRPHAAISVLLFPSFHPHASILTLLFHAIDGGWGYNIHANISMLLFPSYHSSASLPVLQSMGHKVPSPQTSVPCFLLVLLMILLFVWKYQKMMLTCLWPCPIGTFLLMMCCIFYVMLVILAKTSERLFWRTFFLLFLFASIN